MQRLIVKIILIVAFSLISSWCYSKGHDSLEVRATYYHAKSSSVTASGQIVDEEKIKLGEHRWIAVSRDILELELLSFGDTVVVESLECPGLNGEWVVFDKMGAIHKMRIDFLLHPGEINSLKFWMPHNVKMYKK